MPRVHRTRTTYREFSLAQNAAAWHGIRCFPCGEGWAGLCIRSAFEACFQGLYARHRSTQQVRDRVIQSEIQIDLDHAQQQNAEHRRYAERAASPGVSGEACSAQEKGGDSRDRPGHSLKRQVLRECGHKIHKDPVHQRHYTYRQQQAARDEQKPGTSSPP